jgi:cytochrome c oxidase assembly protein subunit 15
VYGFCVSKKIIKKIIKKMKYNNTFNALAYTTIVLIYLLILAGGVVRASGSGMGCPDWPRCFGKWVPPTELGQLPADYKDIYAAKRLEKNQRLAKVAGWLGFEAFAQQLTQDKTMYVEQNFDVTKTWIEYINRLLGVLVGGAILLCTIVGFVHRKRYKRAFYYSLAALFLVIVQGFLGAFVVSTNLLGWLITVHLVLALGVVALLIAARMHAQPQARTTQKYKKMRIWWAALVLVLLAQIVLGAQVRETVNIISQQIADKYLWIDALGIGFIVHRSGAWVVVALVGGIVYNVVKNNQNRTPLVWVVVWLVAQVATGIALSYFAFPPAAQALHIVCSSLMFGASFRAMIQK